MSSQFYTSIANYYQHIFPFNPAQVNFLRNVLPFNGAKILDVGCATGELAFALSNFGFPTWAFDYDAQMVEMAQNSKAEDVLFPVFEQLDMRLITERYPENFFNTIICFGNTLVHLLNDEDILTFLYSANKILVPEGKLTVQILNYQHIIDTQIKSLPILDNEHIRFERNYEFSADSMLIHFNTKLTVKATGQEITNSVKLYAIKKNKLQELLVIAGFSNVEFFGSFNGEPLKENSLPLIFTCQK